MSANIFTFKIYKQGEIGIIVTKLYHSQSTFWLFSTCTSTEKNNDCLWSIIGHTAEYNSQPSCLSWRLGWCHVAPNPNPLGRCMVFLGWPVPILSHLVSINSQVWSQGPSINKWRSSLRKFQGLRGYLPEMGDKGQTDFLLHTSLVRDMGKS